MGNSLGLIEVKGLAGAIEAGDAAVKAANVELLGREMTKGGGLITIYLKGEVGAVKAAVEAGTAAAQRVSQVISHHVIPRPSQGVLDMLGVEKEKTELVQRVIGETSHEVVTPEPMETEGKGKAEEGVKIVIPMEKVEVTKKIKTKKEEL